MSAIKKFFEKKRTDAKFKMAGHGYSLTADGANSNVRAPPSPTPPKSLGTSAPNATAETGTAATNSSRPMSESQIRAAKAAEARLHQLSSRGSQRPAGMSLTAMRARREVEEEMRLAGSAGHPQHPHSPGSQSHSSSGHSQYSHPSSSTAQYNNHNHELSSVSLSADATTSCSSLPSVTGIYYTCPLVGAEVLPRSHMESRIREFLTSQFHDEPALTAALMVQTFNKDKEKVRQAVDTIVKYLDNLLQHPEQEKYRKIRINNRVFQERVLSVEGTKEFIEAIGFTLCRLEHQGSEEEFYVMSEERASDAAVLVEVREALINAEPVRPQLDRNTKVYAAAMGNAAQFDLPNEFFDMTVDELRKEQAARTHTVEKELMLRTKAMRDRDERRGAGAGADRHYMFTLIRVRFPDNLILQGTFYGHERLGAVYKFVRESLVSSWCPFTLTTMMGHKLVDEESGSSSSSSSPTLNDLGLAPAVVVNFSWDADVAGEVLAAAAAQRDGADAEGGAEGAQDTEQLETLRPEILENIETL